MVGVRKHPGVPDALTSPQPAALTRGTSARPCLVTTPCDPQCPRVEASAYLAPDRKHNVSIPRTSPQSKSVRLALAAAGAAAAVAVLASGAVAAASGGPAPSYRVAAGPAQSSPAAAQPGTDSAVSLSLAAIQSGVVASRIQPDSGQHPSQPAGQATQPTGSQHKPAAHRKPAGKLRLAFGDKLAGAVRGTASNRSGRHQSGRHRSGQQAAPAHRGHSKPAHTQHVRACADSTLHWWICHAEGVLERHGTPRSRVSTNAAYIVVQHESGGNPRAANGWDINAAQGHPSEGIAQVIGPTFHAYKLHGYGDIWNPVDNMIAAFRYAISRYGSMNNIPGVVSVRHGGSYVGY
jgi:Transglycosylase SLT domain